MLVTFHAAAGALIGEHVNHPYWAFVLAFISHFLLDAVPHGDRGHIDEFAAGSRLKYIMGIRVVDAILTLVLSIIIFKTNFFIHPVSVAWGIIGGAVPDFLIGIYELSKWKYLKRFYIIHHKIHNIYERFEIGFWHANFWQALVILGILKLLR